MATRRKLSSSAKIPAWIRVDVRYTGNLDMGYMRLRTEHRRTLAAIWQACPTELPDGSRVGARGGRELIAACGCSRAAWWRHVRRLCRLGFVVVVGREARTGRNLYGVPGADELRPRNRATSLPLDDGVVRGYAWMCRG